MKCLECGTEFLPARKTTVLCGNAVYKYGCQHKRKLENARRHHKKVEQQRLESVSKTPQRITKKRGQPAPPSCIYVGVGSRWANPLIATTFCITRLSKEEAVECYRQALITMPKDELKEFLRPLKGKSLVCWCREDEICHGDVLLELANQSLKPNKAKP